MDSSDMYTYSGCNMDGRFFMIHKRVIERVIVSLEKLINR